MSDFKIDIEESVKVLNAGGIILYPTDTIWGIGCNATNSSAVKKIYQLKNREEKKSMIILVADEKMLQQFVSQPSQILLSFIAQNNKPTTSIFQNAIDLPKEMINEDGTIAVRIVKDEFCLQLIAALGKPLVSTSANISGEPYPHNFHEISSKIKSGVDYIVQHRQNDLEIKSPSSIIKLNDKGEIEILR